MGDKQHIVHVIPEEGGGGAEQVVRELHEGLSALGLSCERVHFRGSVQNGPPVTRFGRAHNSPLNILDLRGLLKARRKQGFSRVILHSHLTHGFCFSLVAQANLPITWVHTEHSTTNGLWKIAPARPVLRQCYLRLERFVAISQGTKDAAQETLGIPAEKITRIYNGTRDYGLARRSPISGRALRFVSVGSLNDRKGFDVALRALARIALKNWEYTIVGEGPARAELQQLAAELAISDKVRLVGWADPADYLRSGDLQLIPSRWEGFGLVAGEGMSTGLRILASNVDGLREVVGEDPGVVRLVDDHESPESWTAAIDAQVAALPKDVDPSSTGAVERAKLFGIPQMVEEYARLYESLDRPGPRSSH